MSSPPSSSSGSPERKTPMSIKRSYSARVQRRVRTGYIAMKGTLRQAARDVNVADSGRRGGPEAQARPSGSRSTARPAAAQPVKPTARWATFGNPISRSTSAASGALPAGAVHDDALGRIDLAGVVMRGRVEPELEHPARHVGRAGNEAELPPLAHVA